MVTFPYFQLLVPQIYIYMCVCVHILCLHLRNHAHDSVNKDRHEGAVYSELGHVEEENKEEEKKKERKRSRDKKKKLLRHIDILDLVLHFL